MSEDLNAAFIEFMRITNSTLKNILERLDNIEDETEEGLDELKDRVVALENKPNPFQLY